jgi:hypothetical protein
MGQYLNPEEVNVLTKTARLGIDLEHIENYSHFLKTLEYQKYVLKPNREGGGNNLYDE